MKKVIKTLYLDLETTGLNEELNGVVQIAGIIDIGGKTKTTFNLKCRPLPGDAIDQKALDTIKKTEEELVLWNDPFIVAKTLIGIWDKYINKFEKEDKFVLTGYNVGFDDKFMRAWFKKLGQKYYGSYIHPYKIDVFGIAAWLRSKGVINPENLRLETLASYLGLEHDAHDAFADIKVTREIDNICGSYIRPEVRVHA